MPGSLADSAGYQILTQSVWVQRRNVSSWLHGCCSPFPAEICLRLQEENGLNGFQVGNSVFRNRIMYLKSQREQNQKIQAPPERHRSNKMANTYALIYLQAAHFLRFRF